MSVAALLRRGPRAALSGTVRAPLPIAMVAVIAMVAALAGCASAPDLHHPPAAAPVDTITLFPIEHYDQNVDHWLPPDSPGYDAPFLSAADQRAHFDALFARYFGTAANAPSPWNPAYVSTRVYRDDGADIAALQARRIERFDNDGKSGRALGYGENFRPHDRAWIDAIARNVNVAQFTREPGYRPERRAIATGNLMVRELPTRDPSFYDRHLAGEGYPFDNLQISAVRPGTPLYVLGGSADGAWQYVQTPDVQGWVRSDGVAFADARFIDAWRAAARASLGAVTAALAPVRDTGGAFRFDAPAGTLLPLAGQGSAALVPARDADGRAVIRSATLDATQIAPMPLAATPRHLAQLMKALIGRPYGWGNSGLYNDCSSELQSIFAAFGVWLPRHSSTQMSAGRMTDLSASTPDERLDYLARHGEPMRTLIYIGGHVMLYLGNTTRDGVAVPVVYQDVWGLRPADNSARAVIGGSVILPLLAQYPEDPALQSLAGTRTFQISILGDSSASRAAPADEDSPAG